MKTFSFVIVLVGLCLNLCQSHEVPTNPRFVPNSFGGVPYFFEGLVSEAKTPIVPGLSVESDRPSFDANNQKPSLIGSANVLPHRSIPPLPFASPQNIPTVFMPFDRLPFYQAYAKSFSGTTEVHTADRAFPIIPDDEVPSQYV